MSSDGAPSSPCFMLENRGLRIYLNALGRKWRRTKRAKGLPGGRGYRTTSTWSDPGAPSRGGCIVLAPPLSKGQSPLTPYHSAGKGTDQPFIAQSSGNTEHLRSLSSSVYTATGSYKPY